MYFFDKHTPPLFRAATFASLIVSEAFSFVFIDMFQTSGFELRRQF
jgi:hypothetical protein